MKPKSIIEEEVNRTMDSLDGIMPTDTPKFFYGRLKNRMDAKNPSRIPWRLSLAYSTALLILLINAFTLIKSYSSKEPSVTVEELLAEDYSYSASIYEFTED